MKHSKACIRPSSAQAACMMIASACLLLTAGQAHAALLVDIGRSNQNLQAGYSALTVGGEPSTASQTFTLVDLGAGPQTFTVALNWTGWTAYYGTTGGGFINVTNGAGTYNNLLYDGFFGRRSLVMTLSGLTAGQYTLITSNRGDSSSIGTITSALSDADGTTAGSYSQPGSGSASDLGYNLVTYNFVSDGIHPITLTLSATDGHNPPYNAALNGFSLAAVPEPATAALLAIGGLMVLAGRKPLGAAAGA